MERRDEENILFFHLKVVPDYSDNGIFWFENKGKKGKASFIWKEHSIKQWLAIGDDSEISNLLDSILIYECWHLSFCHSPYPLDS